MKCPGCESTNLSGTIDGRSDRRYCANCCLTFDLPKNSEYIEKTRHELRHANSQYRRALAREQAAAIDMGHVLPRVSAVRAHYLALKSTQKWLHRIIATRRSLALMGVDNV